MYNPLFRFRGVSKPAGYFPRATLQTNTSQLAKQPYAPYSPLSIYGGQPARLRFIFVTGALADYNGKRFTVLSPDSLPITYEFHSGAAPAPPVVGIPIAVATAVGIATAFYNVMRVQSPFPHVGNYRAYYLLPGGSLEKWSVTTTPQPRVGLVQPFNGSYGNQKLFVEGSLNGILEINGITDYGSGGESPLFYGGIGLEVPLLWGKQRALGPSSGATVPSVTNPED